MMTIVSRCVVAFSIVAAMIGAPVVTPPIASAGCQPFGPTGQLCDDPLRADGTWQRCIINTWNPNYTKSECFTLGGNHFLPPFEPPGHIDP
jgi:hypothetical protein